MFGVVLGSSGGAGLGWPGCAGCGVFGGVAGSSGIGGSCCIFWTPLPVKRPDEEAVARLRGLPNGHGLL